MLTLLLLRHAKSSWDDPDLDDFNRPLNGRGEKAAPMMGRYLKHEGWVPDLILCSTARRTRETLDHISEQIGDAKVTYEDGLYLAEAEQLLARLGRLTDGKTKKPETVMIVGHNPGLHDLAVQLASRGDAKSLNRLADKFPTAALAKIDFEAKSWRDIARGDVQGRLTHFITPKDIA
jgi:phosphohistidine phosphatase